MKKIIYTFGLIASFNTQAQDLQHNYKFDFIDFRYKDYVIPKDLEGSVKEVKVLEVVKKKNTQTEILFNAKGKVIESVHNGKKVYKTQIDYTEAGLVKNYITSVNNTMTFQKINVFDEKDRLIESTLKSKGGKIKSRNTWVFGEDKCELASKRFGKGGQKLKRTWEYSYYSPCDKSKSVLKNAKGKVLKIWTYDCKKEGEQLQKKKDETQVCKWEENDGKYLTKVYQNFDEKGRIRKTVSKYNSADTSIVEQNRYDGNDKLKSKTTFLGSYDKQASWESFSKNGKRQIGIFKEYNEGKLVKEEYFIKQKKTKVTSYEYNEKGLLSKKEINGKKGKVTSSSTYDYAF